MNPTIRLAQRLLASRIARRRRRRRRAMPIQDIPTIVGEPEEGDICGFEGCQGRLEWRRVRSCSCFISPPCSACVDAPLICDRCDHIHLER